jgi:cell division protein FtsX
MMNEFEEEFIQQKKTGSRWFAFFLICLLGFSIGLALGFYLGILSLVNVINDLTDNTTVVVDLNEEAIVDYTYAIVEEQYGGLATSVILGDGIEDLNLTDDEMEKISTIVNSSEFDMVVENIDPETAAIIKQIKEHPEDRDIKQTAIGGRLAE